MSAIRILCFRIEIRKMILSDGPSLFYYSTTRSRIARHSIVRVHSTEISTSSYLDILIVRNVSSLLRSLVDSICYKNLLSNASRCYERTSLVVVFLLSEHDILTSLCVLVVDIQQTGSEISFVMVILHRHFVICSLLKVSLNELQRMTFRI